METNIADLDHRKEDSLSMIELENEAIKIALIPDLGGKIVQLSRKETGTAFLKESDVDLSVYARPQLGDAFLPPYASGFDECFPNISPSMYQFKGDILKLPDHGELWTQPWNFEHNSDEITLWTRGNMLNYRFAKHVKLKDSGLEITYELESFEEVPFDYIWSAHPLLQISEGDELLLPEEISEVVVNASSDPSLGTLGDTLSWPKLFGKDSDINFNYVQPKNLGFAAKLFSNRLSEGRVGIYKKQSDESLLFSFDVNQVPYLGIWLCYGGWPEGDTPDDYTLAVEPCSSRPDSLEKACQWGEQQKISPSTIKCWQLELQVSAGKVKI